MAGNNKPTSRLSDSKNTTGHKRYLKPNALEILRNIF